MRNLSLWLSLKVNNCELSSDEESGNIADSISFGAFLLLLLFPGFQNLSSHHICTVSWCNKHISCSRIGNRLTGQSIFRIRNSGTYVWHFRQLNSLLTLVGGGLKTSSLFSCSEVSDVSFNNRLLRFIFLDVKYAELSTTATSISKGAHLSILRKNTPIRYMYITNWGIFLMEWGSILYWILPKSPWCELWRLQATILELTWVLYEGNTKEWLLINK